MVSVAEGSGSPDISSSIPGSPSCSFELKDLVRYHASSDIPVLQQELINKQPIGGRYLGHVTGYQPIRDQVPPVPRVLW